MDNWITDIITDAVKSEELWTKQWGNICLPDFHTQNQTNLVVFFKLGGLSCSQGSTVEGNDMRLNLKLKRRTRVRWAWIWD